MKFSLKLLLMVSNLLFIVGNASAAYILDTGEVFDDIGGTALWGLNPNTGTIQWLGAKFEVTSNTTITSIETFLHSGITGSATAAIYTDGGSIPGRELFSSAFTTTQDDDWNGIYGQSWSLDAGTYWATFEVRSGQTFSGYSLYPTTSLENWAFTNEIGWCVGSGDGFSIRIQDDNTNPPVPVPSALILLSSGILCIVGVRRKKTA